jgi:hypothetical protein
MRTETAKVNKLFLGVSHPEADICGEQKSKVIAGRFSHFANF